MSDEETNALHMAIMALYGPMGGAMSAQASQWLADFQTTMGAWTACDRLLREKRDAVSVCFAAQTIRQKILKSLKELPADSLLSLRESLTAHLASLQMKNFDPLNDVTATQLCLATADLYIQVHEWKNWVAELLNSFNSMDGDRTRMLLVLLRVFPEEIDTIRVGENRRREVREEIALNAHPVLMFLSHVLEQMGAASDEDMIKKVVQCLAAYLTNPLLNTDELAQSQLLATIFQILYAKEASTTLHGCATEGVLALRGPFKTAMDDEDIDKLQNFGRIFVEMAESLLEFLINGPRTADESDLASFETLDLLLMMAEHHDYSLVEMTFHIWYRISEALFQIDNDDHVAKYAQHVTRYLKFLFKHVRYEPDMFGLPPSGSELTDFRQKAAESVKDVVYIVGTDKCVVMMFNLMVEAAATGAGWEDTEAALFIISQFLANLLPEEDSVVPDIVRAICSLPTATTHPALLQTCAELLGSACDWLQKHQDFQLPVLAWLSPLVVNPLFASGAAEAVQQICHKCAGNLAQSGTITRLRSLIPVLEATTTNSKGVEAAISLVLRSATEMIMLLPEVEMARQMNEIGMSIVVNFSAVRIRKRRPVEKTIGSRALASSANGGNNNKENSENHADAWKSMANDPMVWVDRIASVFREVQPWNAQAHDNRPAPWLELALGLWNPLSQAFKGFEDNTRMVEHICRSIRFLVRSLGVQSQGIVQPLVAQMVDVYQKHAHSCILYLSSILVDEYGVVESLRPGLIAMLETLATTSFVTLKRENGLRDNPDTVDDLFRLASRFVLRAPSQFFQAPISSALFDCGIIGLSLDHVEANRSITRFICSSIDQLLGARRSNYRDPGVVSLEKMITEKAGPLVSKALRAGCIELSSHLRRDQADILNLIASVDRQLFSSSLHAALNSLPQSPPCATPAQLEQFYTTLTGLSDAREMYVNMRDLARLYD
ncbi:tsr-1 [Pristionchus pacificus]|uniref:Tsr-1 n=1 Tax=Pristionchus pacificus TaxID=54126 RepID=A0A2A6B3K2_PRIPA|nr:tsr-1 [Pristionchus pacificus]|eukprot:PDM60452.1 tsr-1 [Pristionchus pacificus]